jgi:uncharacterized membrane protein
MTSGNAPLERLEHRLGRLLMAGVVTSALCLALGLAFQILAGDGTLSRDLLAAGLMILMATPMLRVIVSAVEYMRMGEWSFVATTAIVLAELAAGVIYALHR